MTIMALALPSMPACTLSQKWSTMMRAFLSTVCLWRPTNGFSGAVAFLWSYVWAVEKRALHVTWLCYVILHGTR